MQDFPSGRVIKVAITFRQRLMAFGTEPVQAGILQQEQIGLYLLRQLFAQHFLGGQLEGLAILVAGPLFVATGQGDGRNRSERWL